MITRKTILQTMGIGLTLALWVCLDPILSAYFGINLFPYVLSAVLAFIIMITLLLFLRIDSLWREKDRWAIIFGMIMAQFSGFALGKLDMLELATVILTGFWLIVVFVEGERKIQVSPLFFFILGLLFLAILTLVNRPPITSFVAIGEKFILFFLVVDFLRKRSLVKTSAHLLVWTGVFSAVVAIIQFVVFLFWGMVWTFGAPENNPNSILKPTFLGMMVRAIAFFPNPAGLNDYLLVGLPLALFAAFFYKGWGLRSVYIIAAFLMISGIVLTWSASGLIGLGIIFLLFFYIYRPAFSIQYSCLILFVAISAYFLSLWEWGGKLIEGFGGSLVGSVRMDLLELGMASLERNPLIGLGVQNFGSFSGNFFPTGPYILKYPVHNAFIQMATELGIIGGLLFLGIVLFVFIRLLALLHSNLPVEEKWIFKGFLLAWAAILVHMMTEPMAYEGTLWLILGLIEGSAIVMIRESRRGLSAA